MKTNNTILPLTTLLVAIGCSAPANTQVDESADTGTSNSTDGMGESTGFPGDGDGDSGDGDSGDGDGDSTGDGDGDSGDGDGDGCSPGELSCECSNGLCLGDLECVAGTCQEPDPNSALLRFVHLSPELGPVDVYLSGSNDPLWSGLGFREGVDYVQVPPGEHELLITLEGETETILAIQADNLESFIRYSASLYGEADLLSGKVLLDDAIGIDPAGIRIQVVHIASGWGQVDLYNLDAEPPAQVLNNFSLHSVHELDLPAMIGGLGVDTGNDGTADFEFQIPGYPGGGFYDLYLAQGQVPFMLFHRPDGSTHGVDYQGICEDVYVGPGELCDDGNQDNTDDCLNGCIPASCGDGFLWAGQEECDDGNNVDDDYCSNACVKRTKYMFITSSEHNGNLGGYEGANAICNMRAGEAGLPGTYKAWLSDDGGSPNTRMVHSPFFYIRVDGASLAHGWDDLTDGSPLNAPPNLDEHGDPGPVANVCQNVNTIWSNTTALGNKAHNTLACGNWNIAQNGIGGLMGGAESTTNWSDSGCSSSCLLQLALLCIQQ